MTLADLAPVLAIFSPLLGAALVPAAGRVAPRLRAPVAVGFAGWTAAMTLLSLFSATADPFIVSSWIPALRVPFALRVDGLGALVAAIAGVLGFLVVVYSLGYMRDAEREGYSLSRYYALLLLFIGGMIALALSEGLLAFYVFWEVVGLCSFALISFYHRDPRARAAGLKAFAVTRIGDIGLLVGIVALWSGAGVVAFGGLLAGALPPPVLGLAGAGFLLAAVGKSAQFPLHVWLPDAMEAPTPVSALIHAATMVNAGVYLLARSYPAFAGLPWWPTALIAIGATTAVLGALSAFYERDLKRVLAFSTLSQLGFMVAAVGAGAVLAAALQLLSHAVFKALLFLATGGVVQAVRTRDLYAMGGLRREMPVTAAGFLAGTLALVGIPVLSGFWTKELLLEDVLARGGPWAFSLLVLGALLTTAYAWRAYALAFLGPRRGSAVPGDPPAVMTGPVVLLAGAALAGGLLLAPVSGLLWETMPAYPLPPRDLGDIVLAAIGVPALLVLAAILVLSATLLAHGRPWFDRPPRESSVIARAVRSGFLMDALARRLAAGTSRLATRVGRSQTGDLNLNSAAILGAVLAFVAILLMGVV